MSVQILRKLTASQQFLPIVIVLLGAVIRLVGLPLVGSLSFDEAWSVWIAQKDIASALEIVTHDKHPPLFYGLLLVWVKLVGTGEFSLRFLSTMFGVANIAILYHLGRRMFDRNTGLIAALLIAVNPLHIWFSQEARMYQITVTFSLLSTAFLWEARAQNTRKHWVGYMISTLLLVLTHYVAGLLVVGQGVFLLLDAVRNRSRLRVLRTWLILLMAVFLVCLPWLPRLISQVQTDSGSPPWIAEMLGTPSLADLSLTFLRDFPLGFPEMYSRWLRWATYLTVAVLIISSVFRTWFSTRFIPSERRDAVTFCLCALIVPVSMIWLLSQIWPTYVLRYLLAFSGYLYLLFAWGALRLPSRWGGAVAILFLLIIMFRCVVLLYGGQRERDWETISNFMQAQWQEGDVLVIVPPANWIVFGYYTAGNIPHDLGFYRQIWPSYPEPTTEEALTLTLLDQPIPYQRLWWIDEQGTGLAAEWSADPDQVVSQFMDRHFDRIEIPSELCSQWGNTFLYQLNAVDQLEQR